MIVKVGLLLLGLLLLLLLLLLIIGGPNFLNISCVFSLNECIECCSVLYFMSDILNCFFMNGNTTLFLYSQLGNVQNCYRFNLSCARLI
jgi:hypothetical protein